MTTKTAEVSGIHVPENYTGPWFHEQKIGSAHWCEIHGWCSRGDPAKDPIVQVAVLRAAKERMEKGYADIRPLPYGCEEIGWLADAIERSEMAL